MSFPTTRSYAGFAFALSFALAPAMSNAQGMMVSAPIQIESKAEDLQVKRGVQTTAIEILADSAVAIESERSFSELSIANPEIADISTISDKSIYVFGRQPGRTTLMLMGADGSVMTIVDVLVTPDISELQVRLGQILPEEKIVAMTASDGIVLSGAVSSEARVSQAVELAERYAPGRVSNLLTVEAPQIVEPEVVEVAVEEKPVAAPDAELLLAQIQAILPQEKIGVHTVANTVVLSGTVSSAERMNQAMKVAKLYAPDSAISSLLSVEVQEACVIRTRKGGELIETPVPCVN